MRELTERLDDKTRLRAKTSLSLKEFWKLVRQVIKKSGALEGVMDQDGVLQTEQALV